MNFDNLMHYDLMTGFIGLVYPVSFDFNLTLAVLTTLRN